MKLLGKGLQLQLAAEFLIHVLNDLKNRVILVLPAQSGQQQRGFPAQL